LPGPRGFTGHTGATGEQQKLSTSYIIYLTLSVNQPINKREFT